MKIQLIFAAIMMGAVAVAQDTKKDIADMRIFGLEFPQNKQDEHKNTFLHRLALECKTLEDWSEVMEQVELFMDENKKWMPNPFILNANNRTARKEAKKAFKETGNPVCVGLILHFKQMEDNMLGKLVGKSNRVMTMAVMEKDLVFPEKKRKK